MWKLILFCLQFYGVCSNSVKHLATAGENLALLPLQNGETETKFSVPEEAPTFFDLAISRLQSKVGDVINGLWESLGSKHKLVVLSEEGVSKGVLDTFALVRSDVFALEQQLDRSNFENSLKYLVVKPQEKASAWLKSFSEFSMILGKVKLQWGILDNYMSNSKSTGQLELEDFARSIIQPGSTQKTAMLTTLEELNSLAIPGINGTRSDLMHQVWSIFSENVENMCTLVQSPSQFLMNLYTLIALTELKAYVMVQFSYVVFKIYGHDSLTMEVDISKRKFRISSAQKISFAKDILSAVSNDIWRCDDKSQGSYVQLTKLLQGHLENEVDLNNLGSCRDNCAAYKVAEPLGCYQNMFCAKQSPCKGRLFDCQFFNADAWVCMSQNRDRKYDWIEYENGIQLGTQNQCINKVKVDSWWRFLIHCSYCLCLCDSPSKDSDRYWSLQPQVSEIESNKVVTGVRFVKKNRVIHLEIEQGVALREGNVQEESREWIESPIIDVNNASQEHDYKTMKYEERSLDLDEHKVPPGHVITGVRLRDLGGHLNMEIRVTPIRFSSGKLMKESSTWVGNDNTPASLPPKKRQKLEIISPDVPTKYHGMSVIDSGNNQYLQFGATSAYKDVSQTTIPFIDAQPVAPRVASWLSGLTLYHKGAVGYGGYVGLKVSTYDLSRHLVPKKLNENEAYQMTK